MKDTINFVEECKPSRITSINVEGNCLTVEFTVPVPGFADPASVSETFDLHAKQNTNISKALAKLELEIEASIKSGTNVSENMCSTCKSHCCSEYADAIWVTPEDVKKACAGEKPGFVKNFEKTGVQSIWYGKAKKQTVNGEEYCIFYDAELINCSIHHKKPQVCKDYSPYTCSLYVKASDQIISLRKKAS